MRKTLIEAGKTRAAKGKTAAAGKKPKKSTRPTSGTKQHAARAKKRTAVARTRIARRTLTNLVPAPYNPRQISDEALEALGKSIDRFGCVQPIIVNERTGLVVGGHQRLKILLDRGQTRGDVVLVDLSPAEEKALNVALNNPQLGGRFTPALDELLLQIHSSVPDLYEEMLLDTLMRGSSPADPASPGEETAQLQKRAFIECPRCGTRIETS